MPTSRRNRSSSWRSRRIRPACPDNPDETFASMGNYVFTTDALVEVLKQGRPGRELGARHGRQHHADDGREASCPRLRLQRQRRARRRRTATAATGATSERWTPTTTPTRTSLPCIRYSTCTTAHWPIYTSQPQLPPAKFVERRHRAGVDRRRLEPSCPARRCVTAWCRRMSG